uniref:Uncharacterized protein n=1 Tax=Stomoxys calcitrans TaxID=35570 RepID=A0A1I8PZZ3_STOCA
MAGKDYLNNTATLTNFIVGKKVNNANNKKPCSPNNNKHLTEQPRSHSEGDNYKNVKLPHPFTLCLVVIMASIVLMPNTIEAAAMRKQTSASDVGSTVSSAHSASAKVEKLLLLSSAIEKLAMDYMEEENISLEAKLEELTLANESSPSSSSSSSSLMDNSEAYDELSPLEVEKHRLRKVEHQLEHKKNLRKRHVHLNNLPYFDGTSKTIVWHNPCNAAMQSQPNVNMPRRVYYHLKKFRDIIRNEYNTLTASVQHIKTDDISSWRLHSDYYTFLPKVKQNSSITLSRWYSKMQIYVASFAYLGRAQYEWDMAKLQYVSDTTKELDQILTSARLILCELEFTINGAHPKKSAKLLKPLSSQNMADRLKFKTKEQQKNSHNLPVEPSSIDMKFTKNGYMKFLAGMRKILRGYLKSKASPGSREKQTHESDDFKDLSEGPKYNGAHDISSDYNKSLEESWQSYVNSQQQP